MKVFVLAGFFLLSVAAGSGVDILSTDEIVYIAWNWGGQSHLIVSDSSATRDFPSPELTIGEIHVNGDPHICCCLSTWALEAPDSIYILDLYSLSTESSYEIDYRDLIMGDYEPDEIYMSARVARHSGNDTPVFISTHYTAYDYSDGELGAATARLVPDTASMDLTLSEARTAVLTFYYCSIVSLTSPVSCCLPEPMCFWHWYFSWHGMNHAFYSGIHEIPPERSLGLSVCAFFSDNCYYMEDMPRLKVAGSCASEILTLYVSAFDSSMFCTVFDALGPEPAESYEFPYDMPHTETPWAMSCNPDDEGLLFVWYEDGSIIARHYQEAWNPDTYIVQSGLSGIDDGDLAVCSDQEGYWVAWMESDRSDPDFVFVPRDSVSSIEESEIQPSPSVLGITPVSNPVHGPIRLIVKGNLSSFDVLIYDIAGRLKLYGEFNDGSVIFNEELPPGTYLARVVGGLDSASCKILVL